jgi:hypothetical protein
MNLNPWPRLNKLLLVVGVVYWLGLGVLQATPLSDTMAESALTYFLFQEEDK